MDVFSQVATAARPHFASAALWAAHALELFPALQAATPEAPLDASTLARQRGLSPHRLRALLEVLALEGHLTRHAPGCFSAPRLPPRPVSPPPQGWGRLAEVIRQDRPLPEDGVTGAAGAPLARFHRHLCDAGAKAAGECAAVLARPRGTLLDLGSGAGVYSRAWLAATQGSAVLVDRLAVLALARTELGPGARADFVEGDLLGPSGEDLQNKIVSVSTGLTRTALLSNLLHLFGPADCTRLIALAARCVGPGGVVAIKDLRLDADQTGPAEGVLFSLNMALFTDSGRVHDTAALRAFCDDAGLTQLSEHRLACAPESILLTGHVPPPA